MTSSNLVKDTMKQSANCCQFIEPVTSADAVWMPFHRPQVRLGARSRATTTVLIKLVNSKACHVPLTQYLRFMHL